MPQLSNTKSGNVTTARAEAASYRDRRSRSFE